MYHKVSSRMIYTVEHVMQYCERGSELGKRKGLPSPLYASYAACQRFGKPRRWHTGSQAVPLHSPVPASSLSSDLHATLSEGLALELSTMFTHSKREGNWSELVQKACNAAASGRSTPSYLQ